MSETDKLVYMAKQIADFFRPYPHAEAVKGVHDHIRAFWTPIMRAELMEQCELGHAKIDPLVREAMRSMPVPAQPPAKAASSRV